MKRIKAYTDLSQSKTLSKILPLESADMFFIAGKGEPVFIGNKIVAYGEDDYDALGGPDVLCWSLAALLGVASTYCGRLEITLRADKKYNVSAVKDDFVFRSFDDHPDGFNNLVDVCVAIIEKLNELNLL